MKKEVGKVSHYFTKIRVAVIDLSDELKVGDTIKIKGATTDFSQKVESMQMEHKNVDAAGKGDSVGMKVVERVRQGDTVFKLEE